MNLLKLNALFVSFGLAALFSVGCGGAGASGGGSGGGAVAGPPCKASTDCSGQSVCVQSGTSSNCMPTCSVSANECGGSASCAGIGQLDVNICQPASSMPSQSNTPDPKTSPKLPCASDAECSKLSAGAVCAQWQGEHDCTIKCTKDSECNPPAVGGVTTSFLGCMPDEGNKSRTVCLPRQECFSNPTACISFPGVGTAGTGIGVGTGGVGGGFGSGGFGAGGFGGG